MYKNAILPLGEENFINSLQFKDDWAFFAVTRIIADIAHYSACK